MNKIKLKIFKLPCAQCKQPSEVMAFVSLTNQIKQIIAKYCAFCGVREEVKLDEIIFNPQTTLNPELDSCQVD